MGKERRKEKKSRMVIRRKLYHQPNIFQGKFKHGSLQIKVETSSKV